MMLDFLKTYVRAVSLDDARFDRFFASGVKRSDFLLFEESVVCEFKEIENFNVGNRVEHLVKKNKGAQTNLKRDLYNTISNALSTANQQIRETKNSLGSDEALGLVILENLIPIDLSVLCLIDAADRKMAQGLDSTDGVLCLDFVNTFIGTDGSYIRFAQIVVRNVERSEKLYALVGEMLDDFGGSHNTPIHEDFHISKADQIWKTNKTGQYQDYSATLNILGEPKE